MWKITRICLKNYKISLFECKNGHKINNIFLDEYEKTQNKDESQIICGNCKTNNKSDSYEGNFYICNNCKTNLCPICKSSHDNTHFIINYEKKNFICSSHNENYNSYCNKCKINLCMRCESNHDGHEIIYFGKIIKEKEEVKKKLKYLRNYIDQLNNNIEEIKKY